MGKKTKAITIHLAEDVAQLVEFNAREERRPVAQLLALWVEDTARAETMKKTDKGTTWERPQYAAAPCVILKN